MSGIEPVRDGRIIIAPKRAENDTGDVGDGWVRLGPSDPDYQMWDDYLRAKEARG